MKNSIMLFFLFALISIGYSQSKKDSLQEAYISYFKAERETIYLHLHKNIFMVKEPIWFKGYVFDKKNSRPFFNTTNVYVILYDKYGNEITSKLFFAQNGVFKGNFDNQKDISTGEYYIQAYTNYMNNFLEDESYLSQPIFLINPKDADKESIKKTKQEFDLQFLPEGGHLISEVTNTIGFKIIDCEGNGIEIEGTVVNSKKDTVATFKSNQFGLGKFDLNMLKNESYMAHYSVNQKSYSKQIPIVEQEGFALSVNNYTNTSITYVTLKTNTSTLKKETNKTYYMVINQNDKISVVPIDINSLKTSNAIPIPNNKLIYGVNTITFFDDQLNPLLERLVFNDDGSQFLKSSMFIGTKTKDSIALNIKTFNKDNLPISTNLSISILPQTSKTYSKKEDIITAFLLKPYLNGNIQDAYYYFTEVDRLKKYNLDLLIMTQGWSKYKWDHIKKGVQELNYEFDVGLTIDGIANIPKTNRQGYYVQMFSIPNNLNEQTSIEDDNHFYFNNFYLKNGAQINFTVYKDGLKMDKIKPFIKFVNTNREFTKHSWQINTRCNYDLEGNFHLINPLMFSNGKEQVLDTVNLTYRIKKEDDNFDFDKSYIANSYSKGIKIDSIARRNYSYVTDIINAHGFVVDQLPGSGQVRIKNRNPVSFLASNEPLLIVDDVSYARNYDIIYNLPLDEIDEIYIDPNGNGYGSRGSAGVIRVYKKKGAFIKNSIQNNSAHEVIIENGFSVEKEFYIPEFYSQSKTDFISYGTIGWESNIITDDNGNASLKIFNTNIPDAIAIIQGFSSDGKLLSEIKELKLSK
ncbi:MAG: Plug domain-containing protein [Gelidibacter sp.]